MQVLGKPQAATGNEGGTVQNHAFDPVSDSLGLTAIFAALPILALFVLLGGLKMRAQWAALVALGIAMAGGHDRLRHAGRPDGHCRPLEGAAFGLFPIMWIVVDGDLGLQHDRRDRPLRGAAQILRPAYRMDQRIQAVIIAFCFGALLEALAGFCKIVPSRSPR